MCWCSPPRPGLRLRRVQEHKRDQGFWLVLGAPLLGISAVVLVAGVMRRWRGEARLEGGVDGGRAKVGPLFVAKPLQGAWLLAT